MTQSVYCVRHFNGRLYQFGLDSLSALLPAKMATLIFALLHVLLFWGLSYWLYRRRIFIKL